MNLRQQVNKLIAERTIIYHDESVDELDLIASIKNDILNNARDGKRTTNSGIIVSSLKEASEVTDYFNDQDGINSFVWKYDSSGKGVIVISINEEGI